MKMYIIINIITFYISLFFLLRKSALNFIQSIVPGLNIYYLFKVIKFNIYLLIVFIAGIILLPIKNLFLTIIYILLPIYISYFYGMGIHSALFTIVLPFIGYPFMAYKGFYNDIEFKYNKGIVIIMLLLTLFIYGFLTRNTTLEVKDKKNPHYVNNLYLSDDYIYNQLNDKEKKAYDYIFDIVKKSKFSKELEYSYLGCSDVEECLNIIDLVRDVIIVEHPEMMNFSSFGGRYDSNKITLHFYQAVPLGIIRDFGGMRIERIIDSIKWKTKNMTDGQKVLYVYEWIGDHAVYDRLFMHSSKNQSIFNVFLMHNAVCAGFAKTAQVIFQNIGIESYGVTGLMNGEENAYHMWNIVKLEDKYYFFDSTWAASINDKNNEYYYNGVIPLELSDYVLEHPEWYPEIENGPMPGVLN